MIYIVSGDQKPLISKKVDELIKKHLNDINDFTLIKYDLESTPLVSIVDDAITYPFGYDHKVIVLNNPYFLTGDKVTLDFEQSFTEMEEYFDSQSEFTTLIFVVNSSKLDKKSSFNKLLISKGEVIALKEIGKYEWQGIVEKRVKENDATITQDATEELLKRVNNDLLRLEQEIDKLATCTKKITLPHVVALVAPEMEDNIFLLLDNMMNGDMAKTMKIYDDFRTQNIEPTQLLSIMASQMRFIYQVAINYENKLSQDEIASKLNVHPYRVKLAINRINSGNNSEYLLNVLDQFSKLDIDIKTGQVDRFQAFELFLLKFVYHYC
jgi:DNA polymerase-3 subunit delta